MGFFSEGELGVSADQASLQARQVLAALSSYGSVDVGELSFPYAAINRYVKTVGKHLMAHEVLASLATVRAAIGPDHTLTRAYLDCVLDKYDGSYRYDSYIALPLLMPLVSGSAPRVAPTQLAGWLMADAVRFELEALHSRHSVMLASRPPVDVVRKRLRLGVRLAFRWSPDLVEASVGHDESLAWAEEPECSDTADRLLAALPKATHPDISLRIAVSVLPVDRLHDEYLFIRVLQSYEAVFAALIRHVEAAIRHMQERDSDGVCAKIGAASNVIREASALFSILATMSVESFRTFREFTEGASAIQSAQYKKLELLCGMPPDERLRSAAFDNVPGIQEDARQDPVTMAAVYRQARAQDLFGLADQRSIDLALIALETAHQRWKMTHFRIAERMLGDTRGSGYTAGVPYLKDALSNRLFWAIPELARRGAAEGP
jgi:tryptophan 2,3-dioxygenase